MSTGNLVTVSDKAASSISNGRPWNRSSNLDSHLSKAVGVMCEALGPSTSSSVLLHHTVCARDHKAICFVTCAEMKSKHPWQIYVSQKMYYLRRTETANLLTASVICCSTISTPPISPLNLFSVPLSSQTGSTLNSFHIDGGAWCFRSLRRNFCSNAGVHISQANYSFKEKRRTLHVFMDHSDRTCEGWSSIVRRR